MGTTCKRYKAVLTSSIPAIPGMKNEHLQQPTNLFNLANRRYTSAWRQVVLNRVTVDISLDTILPNRSVRIRTLTILDEYEVVRLEYEVTPPQDPFPVNASDPALAAWYAQNGWQTSARDDVGTEYDDWGGAAALSSDGTKTLGEFDLHPAPPANARWLELSFRGSSAAEEGDHALYTLRFALPLDDASIDQC